ncbi:MAG: hypothetical protein AB8H86_25275 [Polyangiales bacterium]
MADASFDPWSSTEATVLRSLLVLALAFIACTEPRGEPAPTPTPTPTPSPASTSLDPSSFVTRHGDLPENLRGPRNQVLVSEHDSKIWVSKVGWRHHYRFEITGSGARAQARFAAGLAYVLAEEGATSALGHCSVATRMPEFYQLDHHAVVEVPPSAGEPASRRPVPIRPVVANAHLQSEYAFIDIEGAESMAWFTPAELEQMTGSTFEDPRVRHISGWRMVGDARRSLDLLVVFSPESAEVYVLERTRELPLDEYQARREELRQSDEEALVEFLQSLGVARVSFAPEAACQIPESFGGHEWWPLPLQ